ncbi:MAG: type I DNA topoisomerase [Halanaerobium sp.]|nr:type I DNA topoisomerase [Halanaerobium sp.]
MADKLVIVESPAKAKTIGKFLGRQYQVKASMGHVIDLPKSQLGVDIEEDFQPKYITIRGKGKVLKELRKAAKKSSSILLATDPDREGEAISWHLARALKLDPESPLRIEFNEITRKAIQHAIKEPRKIDQDRVDAQQARRILDRLVGYKLSPLLWKKVKKGLSAGRVQTVAVRILCQREREIKDFEQEEYWSIEGIFQTPEGQEFTTKLHRIKGKKFKIGSEEDANDHLSAIKEQDFAITKVRERNRTRNPAPPFTTSSLQQKAATQLGFSARKTMYVAQQLYEGLDLKEGTVGLITYIRTDSTRISDEAVNETKAFIKDSYGQNYLPGNRRSYKAREGAQDAHEAIRPTSVNRTPAAIKANLSEDQYRLYKLIWERFVASQMAPARFKVITGTVLGGAYNFRASGSRLVFPGFMKVDSSSNQKDKLLPELKEGWQVKTEKVIPKQHFTKPPARYSEATLIKTLEEEGIGRPSTYAPTVATIQQRGYVVKDGGYLVPTELGFIVTDLLVEHFPDVTDIEFTAGLEEKLDQIEKGKYQWNEIVAEFYTTFADRLQKARKEMEEVELQPEETDEECEKCGRKMVIKHGRYGKFLACPGYPECKNTKPYLEKTGNKCFECEDGEIVVRYSKKGRRFYGCSNYPACKYTTWHQPVQEECPECGAFLVKRKKGSDTWLECAKEGCDYVRKKEES